MRSRKISASASFYLEVSVRSSGRALAQLIDFVRSFLYN